jgi:hypothetical protein
VPFLVYHEHSIARPWALAPSSERWSGSELRARHLQRFSEIPEDFTRLKWEFQPFALPPFPILLTSCRVNSRVARGIYFGKLSRACTRANVRRSKAHRRDASMARSWLPLRDVSLRLNKSDEETNPSLFHDGCVDWKCSSSWRIDRHNLLISDNFIQSAWKNSFDVQFVVHHLR